MNDLQKKELEIFKCFVNVCEKMNLTYYMVCGSALGAVKYRGFIPWDDDIDVAMPRDDYEKFCEMAEHYLPKNLFVQTYKTDQFFPQIFCKLRDCNSTYIEKTAKNLKINHGVFIDIFPLDGYPQNRISIKIFEIRKRIYSSMLLSAYEIKRTGKSEFLYKIYRFFNVPDKSSIIAKRYEKMICKYKWKDSVIIANHGNWQGILEYAAKEQYGKGVLTEFEKLKVRIPEKWDEYLTQKYQRWRKDPPIVEKRGHHFYEICDVNTPYTKYINTK